MPFTIWFSNFCRQRRVRLNSTLSRIIENFPEFKKGERNTTKHFTLLEELKKSVDKKGLYDISEAEQDLTIGPNRKNDHFRMIR